MLNSSNITVRDLLLENKKEILQCIKGNNNSFLNKLMVYSLTKQFIFHKESEYKFTKNIELKHNKIEIECDPNNNFQTTIYNFNDKLEILSLEDYVINNIKNQLRYIITNVSTSKKRKTNNMLVHDFNISKFLNNSNETNNDYLTLMNIDLDDYDTSETIDTFNINNHLGYLLYNNNQIDTENKSYYRDHMYTLSPLVVLRLDNVLNYQNFFVADLLNINIEEKTYKTFDKQFMGVNTVLLEILNKIIIEYKKEYSIINKSNVNLITFNQIYTGLNHNIKIIDINQSEDDLITTRLHRSITFT